MVWLRSESVAAPRLERPLVTSFDGVVETVQPDSCVAVIQRDGREYRLLATRTATRIEWASLVQACSDADIVVSERWLPKGCTPRWLKLDRKTLESSGGVAIYLDEIPRIETVASRLGEHPWR